VSVPFGTLIAASIPLSFTRSFIALRFILCRCSLRSLARPPDNHAPKDTGTKPENQQ
jgi:hypothetical protein